MSRKLSRSFNPGRKLNLPDNRPMPERVDELIPSVYHPFGEKIETFSLAELERNLPKPHIKQIQTNSQPAEDFTLSDSYYEHNDSSAESNIWDEYWFPCESESSDLSQSAASFMSWSDEVEEETTKKLQQFYDALESFLYDETPAPENVRPELLDECLLWKSKFPHLRVVGKAILPPSDFHMSSDLKIREEVLAIDESDSDDETIKGSPKPSFLELDDETERFVYDDVTMGTRCEADRSALRQKIKNSVSDSLYEYVTDKMENCRERCLIRERSLSQEEGSIGEKSATSEGNSRLEQSPDRERNLSPERSSSRERRSDRVRLSSRRWTPSQLDQRIGGQRSTTAASMKSDLTPSPRVANSSSSSKLVLRAPVSVVFEPTEARAYHSAAVRVQSKGVPARRLHSFAGRGAKPVTYASRQDAILREIRESQLRLSGSGTRTDNGTGDRAIRDKPRNKTWSGGRHNVLPPLEISINKDKLKSSPRAPSPVRIEVNGTKLTRTEPQELSLRKYSLLGSTSTKVKPEERNVGRL